MSKRSNTELLDEAQFGKSIHKRPSKRVKLDDVKEAPKANGKGLYFASEDHRFLSTGCTLLNLAISQKAVGGGWPLGRVVNIVGDKSTGKTLLAEEAMANFLKAFPDGEVYYRESEAAFDTSYARALGLDTDKIDFGPDGEDSIWDTVEKVMYDLDAILTKVEAGKKKNKKGKSTPILYIIDSLDALTSEGELERDIKEGSYGTDKAKRMSELFRRQVRRCKQAGICLIVISQIRDRIGAFIRGDKYTRAGGRALDFYASIVLHLAEIGKLRQTIDGIKRVTGIFVKAKVTKNKVTSPFKECTFLIRFGYGIDDELSSFDWLEEVKKLTAAGYDKVPSDLTSVDAEKLRTDVGDIWLQIDKKFEPSKGKYA